MRSTHWRTSSGEYVLSMLSMGTACRRVANPLTGSPPTRRVGLLGSSSSGWAVSSSSSSLRRRSNSGSDMMGSFST